MSRSLRLFITALEIFSLSFGILLPSFSGIYGASPSQESISGTFLFYKQRLESALQDMEREFRVNNAVTDGTITTIRSLVSEAYVRLPDVGESGQKNESSKKSVDLYLDLAQRNKSSQTHVANAISQAARFLSEAKIEQITGSIQANPTSGNAPLTTSFLGSGKDPSGSNIPDGNYIWWMREGSRRNVIGTGPILTYSFSKEGNYQVFLDIVSNSRNSRGNIDVLPVTLGQDIEVKPRLGNIVLLINGVNVSNLDQLKISPTLGKVGILFDATASRAVSNGNIIKTEWDFGNGNTMSYDSAPIVERQLYVNEGTYKVSIKTTTNQNQIFTKDMTLIVRDPAAVITNAPESAFVGDEVSLSAKNYLSTIANVEYNWQVQDIDAPGKSIGTPQKGSTFSYRFLKPGIYIVTLSTRSPNGNTDSDSKRIIIESHPPTINLDNPTPLSNEKPNTIIFDASRSFDMDTKSTKGLIYTWMIDGETISLDDVSKEGAKGSYTFRTKGPHTVSLTIANAYGKVSNVERTFDVRSTLTVGLNVTPRASQLGNTVTFQARSAGASFYEWNTGDGSPSINGTSDTLDHIYKKTGTYPVTLRVKNSDGSEENIITRMVYVTDTDSPFALITLSNGTNTVIENPNGCGGNSGSTFIINRSENTTIDGGKSINIDGNAAGLTYTWKYFGQVKTGPTLSEKFNEIGCFPIELTVRSDKNGASHTSRQYLDIRNIAPKITSVTTSIDANKKDSQKVIVNVSANGARDEDGVITSYIWYYRTENDQEQQNIRITQSPTTTFVLPNITEKYYFGVILEDNDGARVDSQESTSDKNPLLIGNEDANINMPLITLGVDKTNLLVDEVASFSASARDILGRDITAKSEYYWDFDGDGQIDKKTTEPRTSYTYKRSGRYNMKLKMINNGSSNTKYQVIYVKNELKAKVNGYRIGDSVYLVNTSIGSYDKSEWRVGSESGEDTLAFMMPISSIPASGSLGTLSVKSGSAEVSTLEITDSMIDTISPSLSGEILIQTYPAISSGSIEVASPSDKVVISAFGNTAKEYIIDTDTKIDSDLDGITDNDKDNKNTPSYSDGSPFLLPNLANARTRNREIKISLLGSNGLITESRVIPLTLTYIAGNTSEIKDAFSGSGSESFNEVDKSNLSKLQAKIRTLGADDRIIFTKYYNNLIENWGDLHDRTQGLLDIQRAINDSESIEATTKQEMSDYIDIILVGDAQATNDISVASRVIEGLIRIDSPNRSFLIERLEKIKAHPGSLKENKVLGREMLQNIETDTTLSNADKLLLKSQLQIIVNGGQESIPEGEKNILIQESQSNTGIIGSIMSFIKGALWIFILILGIILLVIGLGYLFYRFTRKNTDTGFQDFLIDSVAHHKKPTAPKVAEAVVKAVEVKSTDAVIVTPSKEERRESTKEENSTQPLRASDTLISGSQSDPLASYAPTKDIRDIGTTSDAPDTLSGTETTDPLREVSHSIPDWLKPIPANTIEPEKVQEEKNTIGSSSGEAVLTRDEDTRSIPEASMIDVTTKEVIASESLGAPKDSIATPLGIPDPLSPIDGNPDTAPLRSSITEDEELIPDWLRPTSESKGSPLEKDDTISSQGGNDSALGADEKSKNPPNTDLPDWLKASLDDEGNTEKKSPERKHNKPKKEKKIEIPKGKKEKRENPIEKKKENMPSSPKRETNTDGIPDWLK